MCSCQPVSESDRQPSVNAALKKKGNETHLPSRIVLHNLLLPRQRRLLTPVRIPILLGKNKRDEVDP